MFKVMKHKTIMASECHHLDIELETTSNNLADVITWLKMNAYVVIHCGSGARFFHKCDGRTFTETEIKEYIETHRFIYVDVSKIPGLLDDGEWNWYIDDAGFDECLCSLKSVSSNLNDMKHKTTFRI